MKSKVRIAAVQTFTELGEDGDEKNLMYACKALDEASAHGADIICFPESFPGPLRRPITTDPFEVMSAKAKEIGKYVIYATAVNAPEHPGKQYVRQVLLDPDGKEVGNYDRNCPPGPGSWLYAGGDYWDLDYAPGNRLPVFETDLGVIGMLVCSEAFVPELSRALAVQGAELLFLPAGINKNAVRDSWEILLRARAIENLAYVTSCNNICAMKGFDDPEGGLAVICGPEGQLVRSTCEGIIYEDADMDRLRLLREMEDSKETFGIEKAAKPGIFKQWRRPDLWKGII